MKQRHEDMRLKYGMMYYIFMYYLYSSVITPCLAHSVLGLNKDNPYSRFENS